MCPKARLELCSSAQYLKETRLLPLMIVLIFWTEKLQKHRRMNKHCILLLVSLRNPRSVLGPLQAPVSLKRHALEVSAENTCIHLGKSTRKK